MPHRPPSKPPTQTRPQARAPFRPTVEALEERVALSAADVQLLSATTPDSHKVTFTYAVTGDLASFTARVYRSADAHFDAATDRPAGPAFTVTPAAGSGAHTEAVELSQDAARPYVLVVADPGGDLAESAEGNNTASFRKHLVGVVTHGFSLTPSVWPGQMAAALQAQGRYDVAFAYDWSRLSSLPLPGLSTLAAKQLAQRIVVTAANLGLGAGDVVDLHLIGHSRGTAVNSLALGQLARWEAAGLLSPALRGGWVRETMLDPHVATNLGPYAAGVAQVLGGGGTSSVGFFSYRPSPLGQSLALGVLAFQEAARDPLPSFGANVDQPEVFYQQTLTGALPAAADPFDRYVNVWGLSPAMMEALGLNASGRAIVAVDLTGQASHYMLPLYYLAFVVPTLTPR
jgi:hypothetical protein